MFNTKINLRVKAMLFSLSGSEFYRMTQLYEIDLWPREIPQNWIWVIIPRLSD